MNTSTPTAADLYPGLPLDDAAAAVVPHETLVDLAVRFTHMVVSARDSGISPADVAGRAESALREAATADVFSTAVSLAVESVAPGIRGALSADGQAEVAALTAALADPQMFAQWADLLGRDATYLVAITMNARRTQRKANTKTTEAMF